MSSGPGDPQGVDQLWLHRAEKDLRDALARLQEINRQGAVLRAERRALIAKWVRESALEKDLQVFYDYILAIEAGTREETGK